MWRALFLAAGVFLCILGAECLAVDQFVLKLRQPPQATVNPFDNEENALGPQRVLTPPEWAPWSFLATGAITIIYSFTLPRWVKNEK